MPDLLKTESGRWIVLGAVVLAAGFILTRKGVAQSLAQSVVGGAARVAVDTAAGAVIGIGEAVGVPATDADQCTLDLAAGRYGAASFSCPAPRYLAAVFGKPDFEVQRQRFINANQ